MIDVRRLAKTKEAANTEEDLLKIHIWWKFTWRSLYIPTYKDDPCNPWRWETWTEPPTVDISSWIIWWYYKKESLMLDVGKHVEMCLWNVVITREKFNTHFPLDINIPTRLFYSFLLEVRPKTNLESPSLYYAGTRASGNYFGPPTRKFQ